VDRPSDFIESTSDEMAGNAVKSHFICFDFQKTFHSGDIFCTLSHLFVRMGFRSNLFVLVWQLIIFPFYLVVGSLIIQYANLNGDGNEYNGCV